MMIALTRSIQHWERSGQGEGSQMHDEEKYQLHMPHKLESFSYHSWQALASRLSFFIYLEMYLLYFWDVADKFDLTHSCMQALKMGIASGDGGAGVPSLFDTPHKNDYGDYLDDSLSSSTRCSVSKKSDLKVVDNENKQMAAIAISLKRFSGQRMTMQNFEEMQKNTD